MMESKEEFSTYTRMGKWQQNSNTAQELENAVLIVRDWMWEWHMAHHKDQTDGPKTLCGGLLLGQPVDLSS